MQGNRIKTRVFLLYIVNIVLFKRDWYSLRRHAHHIRPPREPFLWPHWGFTAYPKSLFHTTEEAFPQRDNTLIMIHHDATHWYTTHFANLQNTGLFQPLRHDGQPETILSDLTLCCFSSLLHHIAHIRTFLSASPQSSFSHSPKASRPLYWMSYVLQFAWDTNTVCRKVTRHKSRSPVFPVKYTVIVIRISHTEGIIIRTGFYRILSIKKISYIENINIFAPDKHNKDTQRKILR